MRVLPSLRLVVLALTLLPPTISPVKAGAEWTEWRGPGRSAHADAFRAPQAWPEKLTRLWSVEAGAGLASPVVSDGKAWLLTRAGDDEVLTCYDLADGAVVWQQSYAARFFANGGAISPRFYPVSQGRGPFATPAVHGKRVYTLGVNRVLSSFAADKGKLRWQHGYLPVKLPEDPSYICPPCGCEHDDKTFDAPGTCPSCRMALNPANIETSARQGGGNYYGAAASPLIADDIGVIQVGNLTEGVLIGFDPKNGKKRWRHESPIVAYASPIAAELGGQRQVVTLTRTSVVGLDIKSGTELWSHTLDNNAHVATPIVLDDLVIAATYRGPTFALRIARSEEGWSVEKAWENAELTQWLGTTVLDGHRLHGFFFSKRGQFATLDARTGATLWAGEGRQGESATVVQAGHDLLALKNDGTLTVLRASGDALEVLQNYEVAESPTWTYPALFDDRVLIKDESHLTLWSVAGRGSSGTSASRGADGTAGDASE